MTKLPNTLPIPAPDPATPTVAAPAPMYFAAWSMSFRTAPVWNCLNEEHRAFGELTDSQLFGVCKSVCRLTITVDNGRAEYALNDSADRADGATNFQQEYISDGADFVT